MDTEGTSENSSLWPHLNARTVVALIQKTFNRAAGKVSTSSFLQLRFLEHAPIKPHNPPNALVLSLLLRHAILHHAAEIQK